MRKWFLLIAPSLGFLSLTHAQEPVHWTFTAAAGQTVRLVAKIDSGWHVYSRVQPPEHICMPTQILFDKNPLVKFTGALQEKGRKQTFWDKTVGIKNYQYTDSVVYTRPFTLRGPVKTSVSGSITYQACTEHSCLAPKTIPFSIRVP